MNPELLYNEARRQNLFLEYWDDSTFRVTPAENLDPVFEQILSANRDSLLPWLKEKATPWLHLCRQIIEGEFDGADDRIIRILEAGLRGDRHPIRQRALERLHQTQENT